MLVRKYPDKGEMDAVPLSFRIIRWKISEFRRRASTVQASRAIRLEEVQIEDPSAGFREREIAELREAVYRALGKLDTKCRELLLWQLKGLSGDEIAKKAGKTRNAVYIAIHRCRQKLKQSCQEALEEGPAKGAED